MENLDDVFLKPSKIRNQLLFRECGVVQGLRKLRPELEYATRRRVVGLCRSEDAGSKTHLQESATARRHDRRLTFFFPSGV